MVGIGDAGRRDSRFRAGRAGGDGAQESNQQSTQEVDDLMAVKCNGDCFHCIYEDCIGDPDANESSKQGPDGQTYYQRNRDKYRAYQRAYYAANKELCKARQKAYRQENPEKTAACGKAYYRKNRAKILARRKAYYQAHKKPQPSVNS